MDRALKFGSEDGLAFELDWTASAGARTSAELSWGKLLVSVGGIPVWGRHPQSREVVGIEWTWIELLEHLAGVWSFLEFEEGNPMGVDARPDRVLAHAEERWLDVDDERLAAEQRALFRWARSHDLSQGLRGIRVPELWLQRRGHDVRIVSGGVDVMSPLATALAALSAVGDAIAKRVANADGRGGYAAAQWAERGAIEPERFIAIATGLNERQLRHLAPDNDVEAFWELGGDPEPTELLAAARMAGAGLPPVAMKRLLEAVRSCPGQATAKLDAVAVQAQGALTTGSPHEQGYQAASWLRTQHLRVRSSASVDPPALLKQWGVNVRGKALDAPWIDAVACWGPRHGPAIVVNNAGRHAQFLAGRRATLAHEIAHLLLDRGNALPLAEVAGGVVPREIEARANAFAAELLVPREVAGAELAGSVDPVVVLAKLCRRYGASSELVAWQARNSNVPLEPRTWNHLRSQVSHPERF